MSVWPGEPGSARSAPARARGLARTDTARTDHPVDPLGGASVITDAILGLLQTALMGVLSLFPTGGSLPFTTYITSLYGSLDDLNYFLPIAETFALVIGILVVFPILMGITLSLWVLAQIRGSSSSG